MKPEDAQRLIETLGQLQKGGLPNPELQRLQFVVDLQAKWFHDLSSKHESIAVQAEMIKQRDVQLKEMETELRQVRAELAGRVVKTEELQERIKQINEERPFSMLQRIEELERDLKLCEEQRDHFKTEAAMHAKELTDRTAQHTQRNSDNRRRFLKMEHVNKAGAELHEAVEAYLDIGKSKQRDELRNAASGFELALTIDSGVLVAEHPVDTLELPPEKPADLKERYEEVFRIDPGLLTDEEMERQLALPRQDQLALMGVDQLRGLYRSVFGQAAPARHSGGRLRTAILKAETDDAQREAEIRSAE